MREYHGYTGTPIYAAWKDMKYRCLDPTHHDFEAYGGRGITVCREWQRSFLTFLKDMGEKPSRFHSLDRIDNSKGYEPGNCRWATVKQQSYNRRHNNQNSAKTHCQNGHAFEGDNYYIAKDGSRQCRICHKAYIANYNKKVS